MVKLVGFKNFKSKKGEDLCVANVVKDFSKRNLGNGCFGQDIEVVFLPSHCVGLLSENDIGKSLNLSYEINGGRAYITDVSVIK